MGLTEGSILRVFFLCGAFTGVIGTLAGLAIRVVFSLYINDVMSFMNWINGSGVWDPSIRGIYELPAKLRAKDIVRTFSLSLGLSFIVTIFPARRAARLTRWRPCAMSDEVLS